MTSTYFWTPRVLSSCAIPLPNELASRSGDIIAFSTLHWSVFIQEMQEELLLIHFFEETSDIIAAFVF